MDDEYKAYLNSKEWFAVRESLFVVRGKKCERCGSKENIQVHHIHYRNIFREQLEDLMVVCKDCHRKIHGLNKEGHKPNTKKKKKSKKKKLTFKERRKANILKEIENNRRYLSSIYH
jgi:5-methylcytosine-specific restriction endonuclease McrA